MLEIKQELYNKCVAFVQERLKSVEQAITSAQEAAANDTKSSAGHLGTLANQGHTYHCNGFPENHS